MKICKLYDCNQTMPNAHPNKKFCCKKHKDRYHNIRNPRGRYAHLHPDIVKVDKHGYEIDPIEDSMHPQDPYSLGQE